MYIVAIAWLYVTLLMALTESSVAAGLATFVFYGLFPLSIVLYLLGAPQRRRARLRREAEAEAEAQQARERPPPASSVPPEQ